MRNFLRKARDGVSRWFMRAVQGGRILRMPLLGITAISTMTTALQGTMLQNYTLYIAIFFVAGAFVFVWLYDILQVMNLQNRATQDRAKNFAGATMSINLKIRQKQLEVLGKFLNNPDMSEEEYMKELEEKTNQEIKKYRNGINFNDLR